jgi:hypothetical protein
LKFTEGTNPLTKQCLEFMVNDAIACPWYLPMDENDAKVTERVIAASIHNPHIPISEYIRKEFYWNCISNFRKAIDANPALIKDEI